MAVTTFNLGRHLPGVSVERATSAAEALEKAGANWRAVLVPLQTIDGRPITSHLGVIREDSGETLGVVGRRYSVLQNDAAFRWFDPFIRNGEASFENAGVFRGGAIVWILARLNRADIQVSDEDSVRKYLLLSNSHDGTMCVRVGFTPVRVVCLNTLSYAHQSAASQLLRTRHRGDVVATLNAIRDTVNTMDQVFEATAAQYRRLASTRINTADLRKYVREVYGIKEGDTLSSRQRNIIEAVVSGAYQPTNLVAGAAATVWGAYNAVTDYLSWGRGSEDKRAYTNWFGSSAPLNQRALEIALQLAS